MKLSILIPCYNEKATIEEIVRRVLAAPLDLPQEIILVDDGSIDGTREILQRFNPTEGLKIILHERNLGKGAAIRSALRDARGDILLIQDADLEYDPRDYPALLAPILEGRAKVVYGSRFLGGPHMAMLFWHALGNKLLTLITNVLYDSVLSDMETGYKVFLSEVIRDIPLRSRRFEFEPEITAKVLKRGHRIYEVPISYTGREYSQGKKITWRDGFIALWTLLKYRFVD